jgi:hypothetical protein
MSGIERLRELVKGQEDKPLNKVVDYLCTREDMNDKYLNEEKDLKGMISFVRSEAQKQAKDGMAMIDDEVVYGWAIHYFDESNDKLGIDKSTLNKEESNDDSDEDEKVDIKKESSPMKNITTDYQFKCKAKRKDYNNPDQLTLF